MNTEGITKIEVDDEGRLHVVPSESKFPFIYREAMEVHWNGVTKSLFSPAPREWPLERWFEQIIEAARQQGCELVLTPDTEWIGVDEQLKHNLLTNAVVIDSEPMLLARWVQIIAGLVFLPVVLICLAGSLMMVFMENEKSPVLAPVAGILMSALGVWLLVKAFRMILGLRATHGLIGPLGLKVIACFFLLLPLAGIFTGYFLEHPIRATVQTIAYVAFFFGIMYLAKVRERRLVQDRGQEALGSKKI